MPPTLEDRYLGSLLGLACGDAVGTAVEFSPRGTFRPVTDMHGGGPFSLKPGYWTDDTSMAMCLAESLVVRQGFDAKDQMTRYANWWQWGYWSSTGTCFDIGMTVRDALTRFLVTGEPFAGSTAPDTAGNGSLMRLAPVVLFFHPRVDEMLRQVTASSRTTHAAPEALECCLLMGWVMSRALMGQDKAGMLNVDGLALREPAVGELTGTCRTKRRDEVIGSGYAVRSLEAALWCLWNTDSLESAVLEAANLGDDADTTAAITGQIAGALYGLQGIPQKWLERLHLRDEIEGMARSLYTAAINPTKASD
jgi:ADP-ribosyl-[dinitrogen reductase] hydrolase